MQGDPPSVVPSRFRMRIMALKAPVRLSLVGQNLSRSPLCRRFAMESHVSDDRFQLG